MPVLTTGIVRDCFYFLSFDHTLSATRVKHSGESLRFCAEKLDSSLKRTISFNNNNNYNYNNNNKLYSSVV